MLCGYIVEKQREWQGEEIPQELVYVSEGGEREDVEGEEKEKKEETEEEEGRRRGRRMRGRRRGKRRGRRGEGGGSASGEEGGYTEGKRSASNLEGLPLKYNLTTSGSPRIRG